MINRENYEIWFIDYLEDNLNQKERSMVQEFFSQYPDLKKEMESIQNFTLKASESITFTKQEALKKHILDDASNFENACINYLEGNSSEEDMAQLLAYTTRRPEKKKEFQLFQHTILTPDHSIVCKDKSKLYKKSRLVALYRVAWYAAALVAIGLFLSAYFAFQQLNRNVPVLVQHSGVYSVPENKATQLGTASHTSSENRTSVNPAQTTELKNNNTLLSDNQKEKPQKTEISEEKVEIVNEYLQPISIQYKPSVLVFEAPPMKKVKVPAKNPKKTGLLTSIFGGKEKEQELARAAQTLGNVKMAPSVLNLLEDISNERLSYKENNQGDIASLSFKSKLLSFSVPLKSDK